MKANELLLWLSARREGSWQQFRQAVEELHSGDGDASADYDGEFPLHQQLRLDLERLAHVEFFAGDCKEGWRVAPPTLAAHTLPNGVSAVLCGARSPAIIERVLGFRYKINCETIDRDGVPQVIRFIAADRSVVAGIADQAGVSIQLDAPFAILSHLRACDSPSQSEGPSEFPVGDDWSIHEFDSLALTWRITDRRETQTVRVGLFRFTHRSHHVAYFLRLRGRILNLPRAVALYVLLRHRRRNVVSYDASQRAFRLPGICRPPGLLERALVLCSGLPPAYDAANGSLTYSDVPEDSARLAAELLRQQLR